jgi:hypothetical protein
MDSFIKETILAQHGIKMEFYVCMTPLGRDKGKLSEIFFFKKMVNMQKIIRLKIRPQV